MKYRILILSIAAIFSAVIASDSARTPASALSNYTWSYDYTNLYSTFATNYSFSGLDTSFAYRWDMYIVDEATGNLTQSIGNHISVGSATAGPLPFGGAPGDIPWPENYVGPLAVRDNLGNILGRHYVAPLPTDIQSPNSGWFQTGVNPVNDKQIAGRRDVVGECLNPVYAPINSEGFQHTFIPCSVATTHGSYTILHYQIDTAYDPTMDDDFINFYLIPTSTVALEIRINDLINYQLFAGVGSWSGSGAQESFSFIPINTIQNQLPFVDNGYASQRFTSGDNPTRAVMEPGVYNYARNTSAPAFVSDGESVWIVTDDVEGEEWSIDSIGNVGEGGQQTVTTMANTEEVWESYHGVQQINDATAGFFDATVYSFARLRNHTYQVPAIVADGVEVTWTNQAVALNSGVASPANMRFIVSTTYDILEVVTIEESITTVLDNIGLATESGKALTLMLLLGFSMLGVTAFSSLRNQVFVYLIVWTGIGSLFVLGGFGSTLVNTVYIVLTAFMWVLVMVAAQSSSDETF